MHSVFPGDVFDLEPGRLLCADPTDVTKIDSLVGDHSPAVAIIDPPNGQVGRDLLTYLVALHIPRIICWRADLYPGTISQNRKGHWIAWDPEASAPNHVYIDTHYTPALLAYHYGGEGRRPLILHSPTSSMSPRMAPGFEAHQSLLQGHPDYRAGQAALICYDQSSGDSVCAARSIGLTPLVIEPDATTCGDILDRLGFFDHAQGFMNQTGYNGQAYCPQGREYSRRQGV